MTKYYLVASHYDMYTKQYQNEVVVNIPNVDLTTIQAIDYFTSSHSKSELLQIVSDITKIPNLNQLAIKCYKNKKSSPSYGRIIENNPQFASLIKEGLEKKEYYLDGKKYEFLAVKSNNLFFLKELRKIMKIIQSKDLKTFTETYPYENTLSHLVTRYMNSSYDNQESEIEELNRIEKEFSRYKTFHDWIIAQEKNIKKYQKSVQKQTLQPIKKTTPKKNSKIEAKTIEEYESSYEQDFEKQNGFSYQAHQTMEHNLSHLDEDEEEFIEEQELNMMYGTVEEEQNYHLKRK